MNITKTNFKYFTVYETINKINGKKYIGMHATNNLDDNYLGSGRLLLKAISKYGVHNFEKNILFVFDNFDEMAEKEREICNEEIVKDQNYYNLKTGGEGGVYADHIIEKIKMKNKGRKVSPESVLKGLETRRKNGNWYKTGEDHHLYGKRHEEKILEQISNTLKEKHKNGYKVWNDGISIKELYDENQRKEMFGRCTEKELNPSYGSKWLGNEELGVKCYIKRGNIELELLLKEKGWVEKPKNFNSLISVTKKIEGYL